MKALKIATNGKVTSHATAMLNSSIRLTPSPLQQHPRAATAPILECVVLMGIPMLEAIKTTVAEPSSMAKPLWKRTRRSLSVNEYPYLFSLSSLLKFSERIFKVHAAISREKFL